jgi:hypothetical protein
LLIVEDPAEAWFRRRTSHWRDWPPEQLLRCKHSQGIRTSVVIPARNEEATVGAIAGAVAAAFMGEQPLAGEWAASRSLHEALPIPVGYLVSVLEPPER